MFWFISSQYKRMINLLLYIVIIRRYRHHPMLQQSRIISKGSPYVSKNLLIIGGVLVLIALMDSSRFPHQLFCIWHVLNLNIKKVTVIWLIQLGVFRPIFRLLHKNFIAKRLRRKADKWKITCSNPSNLHQKKNIFFRGIYMGVYILVSTDKMKRCDFDFYNYLSFWKSCVFIMFKTF